MGSGGMSGTGVNPMDELGIGPPVAPPGTSMKDTITGAPPAGFAAYMQKKAEHAAAIKEKMK